MTEIAYLAGIAALVAAAVKLRQTRGHPRAPGVRYLCGLLLCLGSAAIVLAPPTLRLGARLEPMPNLTRLVGNELAVAAVFCMMGLLAYAARPDAIARSRMSLQVWIAGAAALAMAALFLSTPTAFSVDFVDAYATRPAIAAYEVVFLSYAAWGLIADIILVTRVAGQARTVFLRIGLWVGVIGAWFGLAWALWKISVSLLELTTRSPVAMEGPVSSLLSAIAILFVALGATMTAWGPHLAHPITWWRARRLYRRLEPLWSALHQAVPQIEFQTTSSDMEFRLYHRVVEIRDGALALARNVHPDVRQWVEAASLAANVDDEERPVVAEAAALATALEARAASRVFSADSAVGQHVLSADIEAEAAWLVRVSDAFAHSPVVEQIRQRVRQELGVTDPESRAERSPHSPSVRGPG